jgi:aminomethyltransferase
MGYVGAPFADVGTPLKLEQRGKLFDATVATMPFVPHRYHRKDSCTTILPIKFWMLKTP